MKTYYYDDDSPRNHFREKEHPSDAEAEKWGKTLFTLYQPESAVVYTEEDKSDKMRVIKEWKKEG